MDVPDAVGLGEAQEVVVAAQVAGVVAEARAAEVRLAEPVGLEQRAHRPVEDEDPAGEEPGSTPGDAARSNGAVPSARAVGGPAAEVRVACPDGGGQAAGAGCDRLGRVPGADPADQPGALLVAPEARHDVRAGDLALDRGEQAIGHLDADLRAALAGRAHRGPRLVGDDDPGHLVVEELGVAGRHERQHAEQDRDREAARPEPPARLAPASTRPGRPRRAAGSSRGGRRPRACAPAGPIRSRHRPRSGRGRRRS